MKFHVSARLKLPCMPWPPCNRVSAISAGAQDPWYVGNPLANRAEIHDNRRQRREGVADQADIAHGQRARLFADAAVSLTNSPLT